MGYKNELSTPFLTQEQFIENVRKKNPNLEVISEYRGARHYVDVRCKICGSVHSRLPKSIYEGRKCVNCRAIERGAALRKTNEQFVKELSLVNPNIEPLEPYVTNDKNITVKCLVDGYVWKGRPHSLLEGHGCPKCADRFQNKRTHEQFVEEMSTLYKDITVIGKFKNCATKVKYRCNICGYVWSATPNAVLGAKGNYHCPKCVNKAPISLDEFLDRLSKINTNAEYYDSYKNISTHARFKCKKCGHIWKATPINILKGRGCPKCKDSQGEKKIENYLVSKGYNYIQEYQFIDCKYTRPLPFDFYLPDYHTCIEYDGEQHFMPVKFGEESKEQVINKFETQKIRDKIKTDYCSANNIRLIRIPYTDFNKIEEILDKYLS